MSLAAISAGRRVAPVPDSSEALNPQSAQARIKERCRRMTIARCLLNSGAAIGDVQRRTGLSLYVLKILAIKLCDIEKMVAADGRQESREFWRTNRRMKQIQAGMDAGTPAPP